MATTTNIELLAQADLLLWLGRLFSAPSPEQREELRIDGATAGELLLGAGLAADSRGRAICAALLEEIETCSVGDWSEEYVRLFEVAGACPINETAYVRRDKGAILADIAGFRRAFGFELAAGSGEKGDHLVCELEFAALLLVMEARALASGKAEEAEICADALAAFARDHLDEWLPLFWDRLHEQARLPLFGEGAGLLAEFWETLVVRRALPRAEPSAPESAAEENGTPYECGLSD